LFTAVEEHGLRVFEKRVLKGMYRPTREKNDRRLEKILER
jgi:hypothetical protein